MKKRIALSVVAALTGGLLAAAPASAASSYSATTTLSTSAATLQTGFDTTTVATFTTALSSVAGGNLVSSAGATLDSVTVTLSDVTGTLVADNLLSSSAGIAAYDTFTAANTETVTWGSSTVTVPQLSGSNGKVAKGSNDEVHVISAYADAATASATLNLVLRKNAAIAAGTYKVKLVTEYLGAVGSDVVTTSAPQYLTITVASVTGRTNTLSASAATVAAGASTSFTVKDAFTAVASDATSTLSISTSAPLSISVAVGAATGGFAEATSATTTSVSIKNTKNAIAGAFEATHTVTVMVAPNATAGDYTVTAGTKTFTVTVSSAPYASTKVELAANAAANGYYTGATGDGVLYAPKAASATRVARITVTELTATGAALNDATAAKAIKVTISGAGSLGDATAGATTSEVAVKASSVAGAQTFDIYGNGTAGTGTVTVYVDGTAVKTYTVKFYGAVASLTATPVYTIGKAAGGATGTYVSTESTTVGGVTMYEFGALNDPAIAVVAKDANGTPVPVSALTMTSSNPAVIAADAFTSRVDAGVGLYTAGVFTHHLTYTTTAGLSGATTDIAFKVVNSDATSASTAAIKITLGGAAKTVTAAFDKATYTVGELAVVTISAKDAAGNAAFDGQNVLDASGLASNLSGGSVASAYLSGGKVAKKVYAPVVAGNWVLSGKDLNGVAVSATAAVTSAADAAITAINAKVASTEATVAALQVTVASVIKSLKVQWWLLKKIAVKVGIKLG